MPATVTVTLILLFRCLSVLMIDQSNKTLIGLLITLFIMTHVTIFFTTKFFLIHNQEIKQLTSSLQKNSLKKQHRNQSKLIFDSLEEGILLVENDNITFMNNEFKTILSNF